MDKVTNKDEFVDAINKAYELYYDKIVKDASSVDKASLCKNLGWLSQILQWEKDERMGGILNLHTIDSNELDQSFVEMYKDDDIHYLVENYNKVELDLVAYLDKLSDEDLFENNKRHWTNLVPDTSLYDWIKKYTLDTFV